MSCCPNKRDNTGSSGVSSSSRRGGRRAPPAAPIEEEMEHIDSDADVVPACNFGIRPVPDHARHWYKTFVPAVNSDPEVAIDDRKLSRKYSGIYNNIRALGFESLFHLGDTVNVNLVKEFYANGKTESCLDAVYEVQVRVKVIPFSSQLINHIMGFPKNTQKLFLSLLYWPNYPNIQH
nr:uncharacterized protein LOC104086745 [Nicotiana tomentosiformis]